MEPGHYFFHRWKRWGVARGAEMLGTGCLELVGLIDQFDVYIYISAYSIFNHLLLLLFVFRKRTLWLVLLVLLVPFLEITISVDIPSRQGSLVSVIAWFEGEQKRKIIWQRQVEEGGPRESRTVSGSCLAAAWQLPGSGSCLVIGFYMTMMIMEIWHDIVLI